MTIYYFVRSYLDLNKKIYLSIHSVFQIPNRFTIDNFEYSIEDIEIESSTIDSIFLAIILGILGLLTMPLGGIIGALIGYNMGLYNISCSKYEAKIEREKLKRLCK